MNKTIKRPGGLTVRLVEALNGFRTKYGYWPTTIEMEASSIGVLATGCLTPLGFFRDVLFKSPSGAAAMVRGASSNGWVEWVSETGKTLAELKRQAPVNKSVS